ncbi:carbohydrate ABC transporter permease [Candidatus Leptofilum sp.]|uniref:carbohydrate ABC transporter permease n=1 Tax=Candidatus Leptofilum sp. TaxID=3241576 RepID=UPI003B58FADF
MKIKTFYQFTSPSLIAMTTLMVFPLIIAMWLGLHFLTFRNINTPEFVGLENYASVLTDPRFWQSVRFTLLYIVIAVPSLIINGFILAMLLNQITQRLRGVFISTYLLPMVVVPVVGTLMFKQMFVPSGVVSWFFRDILEQRFIFSEVSVKILIFINAIWGGTPFPFIVLYAGLLTLPKEQIDAAVVDGATRWQQVRYVALPHLRSLFVFLGLILTMDSYRIFDTVFVLTEMNPVFKADTVMLYIFRTSMDVQRLGKGNAMAILTVIMILIILVPYLTRTYREQIEER